MDPFPEDARKFFEANIDSLEQLEILRILGEDPMLELREDEIAKQIQSVPELTAANIAVLGDRGLLKYVRRDGRLNCQYGPGSPELETQVRRLLELYNQRPVTMIRMVYDLPKRALRDFASAFRIRKED